jgi:uncharacterized protein YdaL
MTNTHDNERRKETKMTNARTRITVLGVACVAALACLLAATGASAKNFDKPNKPTNDVPTTSGLVSSLATVNGASATTSSGGTTTTKHGGGAGAATTGGAAPGAFGSSALVLYDTTGAYGWLGELYATAVGNLASHFGTWKAEPVSQYQAGQIGQYTATVYIGSTYDEPLSTAFLDDVANATHPVIWIYDNIWQLSNRLGATAFQAKYGWMWSQFDLSTVSTVLYNGTTLTRDGVNNQGGIMGYGPVDTTKASVLAWAVRDADGSQFPWAIRSGSLTYLGENPFTYTTETDRLIAFEDMLYNALDPFAPTRHRAMVRLEDINPSQDPAELKSLADYLYSQGIPYGFGVSPIYTDPTGYYSGGIPEGSKLGDRGNGIADVIRYMQSHGGTLVMHGYTHQYSNVPNPYDAVTGDDFEFYRVVENPDHTLNYVGPVSEDSSSWASGRLTSSFREFSRAKIAAPTMFEFPHYMASSTDYQAVASQFATRWERGVYFGGYLSGGPIDNSHLIGEMFPYVVRDAYGTVVLPENCGPYAPEPFYQFKPHTVDDILNAARAELAVRDGIATFYYHPFEGLAPLQQIVAGFRSLGYSFVNPTQVASNG